MKLSERGFSLIELGIVVLILGLILAFAVPSFVHVGGAQQLKGATENFAAQMRLAREKAIATGVQQPMHIVSNTQYHIHYPTGIATTWDLPRGITIVSPANTWYRMGADGRCDASGNVIMRDSRGNLDTVNLQLSGLVLTRAR